MSDAYLGEIRMMAINYAPRGWALCNGQILSIEQNTALYSIFGVAYGGNGTSTFGLPNLQGGAPLCQGEGPGLSRRTIGEVGGAATVTLSRDELPSHTHTPMCDGSSVGNAGPQENTTWSSGLRGVPPAYSNAPADTNMASLVLQPAGQGQPHNNMCSYLAITFIVALEGEYPSRP